ncbi:PREDICTED: uncharacterized protein LOC106814949 [Priapulus caudatus]|uniref:Uncharacterized protein LOC106814949 n=1 Tax=Priapulus caudatus TaxID=37621 RepID=A0ABM1ERK8_PRICU|nr:PREDICTED: uncharacterized protein LOC106814949 [Priapulus caudatus]
MSDCDFVTASRVHDSDCATTPQSAARNSSNSDTNTNSISNKKETDTNDDVDCGYACVSSDTTSLENHKSPCSLSNGGYQFQSGMQNDANTISGANSTTATSKLFVAISNGEVDSDVNVHSYMTNQKALVEPQINNEPVTMGFSKAGAGLGCTTGTKSATEISLGRDEDSEQNINSLPNVHANSPTRLHQNPANVETDSTKVTQMLVSGSVLSTLPDTEHTEVFTERIQEKEDLCNEDYEDSSLKDYETVSQALKECDISNHQAQQVVSRISYVAYENELQMPDIMRLITKDLSEPYSIYTYRYFIHNWPKLCFLAKDGSDCVGAIVCKLDMHKKMTRRGYIAMLAVDESCRRRKIGSNLVLRAIRAMVGDDCDEVVLETEVTNRGALHLYENLGFVRDKRLFRYYLNGVDAFRLKLWLR